MERAYARDSVPSDAYERACSRLLAQFRAALAPVAATVPSAAAFMAEHALSCPRAAVRIARGIPATLEHADLGAAGSSGGAGASFAREAADATEALITLMDVVRLGQRAADELGDPVAGALRALDRAAAAGRRGSGGGGGGASGSRRAALVDWAARLKGMRAAEALSEGEARQLLHDADCAYAEFKSGLAGG